MADTTPKSSYSEDSTLYLYTSLTAGSSHIITATSRLETILKANKISFRALDVATDEKARMLWGRRSKGKKLPGLVRYGAIVGDLEEVEDWNEYGELKQQLGGGADAATATSTAPTASIPHKPASASGPAPGVGSTPSAEMSSVAPTRSKEVGEETALSPASPSKEETPLTIAMRKAGAEAAKKAGQRKESSSTELRSTKSLEPNEAPLPTSVEEPSLATDITVAKIPAKLAESGAKRTSIDKIAEQNSKRSSLENPSEPVIAGEQTHVGLSYEATTKEATRENSMTKTKSPLSEEAAATSSTEPGNPHHESSGSMHRGSSVSPATKEEIEEIEKKTIIPEVEEAESPNIKPEARDGETNSSAMTETGPSPDENHGGTVTEVTASNEGEFAATKGLQPQEGEAADAKRSGASVGD